jgi:predicted Zn-dependent protease with MMP-like domain
MAQVHQTNSWEARFAPSIEELESISLEIYAKLPEFFRDKVGMIYINVTDDPDKYIIDELVLETPYDLLGLFEGKGIDEGAVDIEAGDEINKMTLYRRAVLNHWCENDDTLGAVVANVLIYELSQHFGIKDEEIESIQMAL